MRRKRVFLSKRMKDRRFRRTEEKFLTVFFVEVKKGTSMARMARKAGIGRSTMYEHHHALREVLPDYQCYMLAEFGQVMRRLLVRKNVTLRKIFFEMLVFIMRNKKVFRMFLEMRDLEIFRQMMKRLERKISAVLRLPKNSQKIFSIYTSEVVQVIVDWGEVNFSEQKLDVVLGDIVYLSETCRSRLMPINVDR